MKNRENGVVKMLFDFQVSRESKTGGVPGGVSTALAMGVPNIPIIVWRCVEEVERRGLDIIGKYPLRYVQIHTLL